MASLGPAKRILVTGAAGAPALNFIRSLRMAPEPFYLIGVDCNKYGLPAAETDKTHLVPRATEDDYIPAINSIIEETHAGLVFAQPDIEVAVLSRNRSRLAAPVFMPRAETVSLCHDKWESYKRWRDAGLTVPETRLAEDRTDVDESVARFGDVWLRPACGAAGSGAFHTNNADHARMWLEANDGWAKYTIADYLTRDSVTWQSIWHDGRLVVAQGRRRLRWEFADRAPAGVTGVTGVGMTIADSTVDAVAMGAVNAIDDRPNGIFSVDMTYDRNGYPNPTEINIGRFFTTSLFFSQAGLNMPYIFTKLAFGEEPPPLERRVNPLEPGLMWVRGMDREPVIVREREVTSAEGELNERLASELRHRLTA
jgi:hypothetical protein